MLRGAVRVGFWAALAMGMTPLRAGSSARRDTPWAEIATGG
jgi:hypothetical protein